MIKKTRTALVVMPFFTIWTPNIGSAILKSALIENGLHCDCIYANIDFAKGIGLQNYKSLLHMASPQLGDIVFSSYLKRVLGDESTADKALRHFDRFPQSLVSLLEKAVDFVPSFIDSMVTKITAGKYDLVGFPLIFQTIPSIVLSKRLKEINPNTRIIFGGANCMGDAGLAFHENYPWIDFVCKGEGEELIVELADVLRSCDTDFGKIKGLIWRKNGKSVVNEARSQIEQLDDVPIPNYDEWYAEIAQEKYLSIANMYVPLETARGCWYGAKSQCLFCGLSGEHLNFRHKSAQRAIAEINFFIERYKIKSIVSVDLIFPQKYFGEFLDTLIERPTKNQLSYEVKVNMSKAQITKLARAGITNLNPGIESLNSDVLKIMRKGSKTFIGLRILKWGFELGLNILWNIVYGLPGETAEDYKKMAEIIPFIEHLQPPVFGTNPVHLDRFSPLFKESASLGLENVRPKQIYYDIYDLPPDQVARIAYFYDYGDDVDTRFDYVVPLRVAIKNWYDEAGKSIFFSLDTGNKLYLFDNRRIARKNECVLEGKQKTIYQWCDAGATLDFIVKQTRFDKQFIAETLSHFIDNKYILFVDEHYLSLDVQMQGNINPNLDIAVARILAQSIYRNWMRERCKSIFDAPYENLLN